MEISQVCINQASLENKTKLADDLCRLLQVREKNEGMIKDWLLYISTSNFKLTPGEIYLAFRLAIDGEILNQKGVAFELFPELSIITTGKVLQAFISQKKQNDENYQKSKSYLKSLKQPEEKISDEEKKEIRIKFLKLIYDDLKQSGTSEDSYLLFSELELNGKLNIPLKIKKETYQNELKKYIPDYKEKIQRSGMLDSKHLIEDFQNRIKNKEPIVAVQNICRRKFVDEYLKKHLANFDEFLNIFFPKK